MSALTDRGMYDKYRVERLGDVAHKHDDDRFFVLDPLHDPHALLALKKYAEVCRDDSPLLAADIDAWVASLDILGGAL